MDRVESLTIYRNLTSTIVKLVVTEGGVSVQYSIKSYEYNLAESIRTARINCNKLLKIASAA